jgi:hypothetical protein
VTGIAINIATDLKTSVLAWTAVLAATIAGIAAAWAGYVASDGRRVPRILLPLFVLGCVLALVLGISAQTASPRDAGASVAASDEQVTSRSIQEVSSYTLTSSSGFCPTEDKIDLDTAHSGYGGQAQIGDYIDQCRIEGGLAELVLEDDSIHTPDHSRLLFLPMSDDVLGHDECRVALRATEQLRSAVLLADLNVGNQLCVRTDEGNIAHLTILDMAMSSMSELTIEFTTWE